MELLIYSPNRRESDFLGPSRDGVEDLWLAPRTHNVLSSFCLNAFSPLFPQSFLTKCNKAELLMEKKWNLWALPCSWLLVLFSRHRTSIPIPIPIPTTVFLSPFKKGQVCGVGMWYYCSKTHPYPGFFFKVGIATGKILRVSKCHSTYLENWVF